MQSAKERLELAERRILQTEQQQQADRAALAELQRVKRERLGLASLGETTFGDKERKELDTQIAELEKRIAHADEATRSLYEIKPRLQADAGDELLANLGAELEPLADDVRTQAQDAAELLAAAGAALARLQRANERYGVKRGVYIKTHEKLKGERRGGKYHGVQIDNFALNLQLLGNHWQNKTMDRFGVLWDKLGLDRPAPKVESKAS